MNCKTCGTANTLEIAAKTTGRHATGITKCHRLECGHAWHVIMPPTDARASLEVTEATSCTCGEIATVNALLVEGRRLEAAGETLSEDIFKQWLERVLEALDGIPAESGAPSLVRSAATAAKSPNTNLAKKMTNLNKLLGRAIKAVS